MLPNACKLFELLLLLWHPENIYSYEYYETNFAWTKLSILNGKKKIRHLTRNISSSVTVNVLSSFPDNWFISFCTALVSIRTWNSSSLYCFHNICSTFGLKMRLQDNRYYFQRGQTFSVWKIYQHKYKAQRQIRSSTLSISCFCFLMLATISIIFLVYADLFTSLVILSNSDTFNVWLTYK